MQQSAKADRYVLQNYNKQASHSDGLQSMNLDDRDSERNDDAPIELVDVKYEEQREEAGSNYASNHNGKVRSELHR